MLLGRTSELKYLHHYFDREGSQILVVYGQNNIGKTSLLKEFMQGKSATYFAARACSEREQLYQWGQELVKREIKVLKYPEYSDVFAAVSAQATGKHVLVIDEFHNLVKNGSDFMKELIAFMHRQWGKQEFLVVLVSSSVGWVENSMVKRIGEAAFELAGLLKVKELSFRDCMEYFPNFSKGQCIEAYAILGGYPGYWEQFGDRESMKENIVKKLLPKQSVLLHMTNDLIQNELREPAVYSTILSSIAAGHHKLNDLYLHTGFSRAKISVYLKNLMELELVEKVFSFDTEGKNNVQKGIYRISNHLVHFYFKFIYSHLSDFQIDAPNVFYLEHIESEFKGFVAGYFRNVCLEHLDLLNKRSLLPITYDKCGEWVGKDGNIDIVASDEAKENLLASCNFDKPLLTYHDYERLLHCARLARLTPSYIYLYSSGRFDEKLTLEAKVKKNITLVTLKEL